MLRVKSVFCQTVLLSTCIIALPKVMVSPVLSETVINNSSGNINGSIITNIPGKTVSYPTFSPDGKFLAYAEDVKWKDGKSVTIRILNLISKQTTLLVSDQLATKYDVPNILGITWEKASSTSKISGDRLVVILGDYHGGGIYLTYEPFSKKLITKKEFSPIGIRRTSPEQRAINKHITSLFPTAQFSVGHSNYIDLGQDNVLLQGEIFEREKNLWLLNLEQKSYKRLHTANSVLAQTGIHSVGRLSDGSHLFSQGISENRHVLFRYAQGQITKIKEYSGDYLYLRYNSFQRAILVQEYNFFQKGDNSLYILEKGELRKFIPFKQLSDVAVSMDGKKIAYVYLQNGKQQIVVRELI
jgi:WD40-like Beta Propeller Repeat